MLQRGRERLRLPPPPSPVAPPPLAKLAAVGGRGRSAARRPPDRPAAAAAVAAGCGGRAVRRARCACARAAMTPMMLTVQEGVVAALAVALIGAIRTAVGWGAPAARHGPPKVPAVAENGMETWLVAGVPRRRRPPPAPCHPQGLPMLPPLGVPTARLGGPPPSPRLCSRLPLAQSCRVRGGARRCTKPR